MDGITRTWVRRRWFATLLLIALTTRALVPIGFMPGPGGMMVCPGYAPVSALTTSIKAGRGLSIPNMGSMDMPGVDTRGHADRSGRQGPSPEHEGMGFCPYAAAASVAAMFHTPVVLLPPQITSTVVTFPPEESIPRSTIVPTRLPRGPPAVNA